VKVSDAISFCLQCHKINSRPNTIKKYEFLLRKFGDLYLERKLESISTEEIISLLADLSEDRKQNTKLSRYTTLSAFFNLIINALIPEMQNPCQSPAAKNLFNKHNFYLKLKDASLYT
jgi:hypothetical protein